jgi:NitT/TauT family transport system substrate-binding protein
MSSKKLFAVSLALTAGLASACGSSNSDNSAAAGEGASAELTTVTVGSPGSSSDAGLYIADARGYFKALGITMDYQQVKGGGDLIPLLSTGKLDVGGLSLNSGLINAAGSGNDLELVADKGSYTDGSTPSYGALVVRPDEADKIKTAADLKGRTIAVGSAGSALDVSLSDYLGTAGLTTDDVKLTVLGQAERVVALQQGAVDVSFVFEPFLTQAVSSGAGVLMVDGGVMSPNQQVAGIVYGGAFSKKNPKVAQNFMSAYLCGLQDYNDAVVNGHDPDPVIQIIADATGDTPENLKNDAPIGLKPDGSLNVEDVQHTIDGLTAEKLVTNPVKATELVNTKFLDGAKSCDDIRAMAGGTK